MFKSLVLIAFLISGCSGVGNYETPDYKVIRTDGAIEIRQYAPVLYATVKVEGEQQDAIRKGFRILADYIFGNNQPTKDIAMTTPVTQTADTRTTIAMTTPVTQQSDGQAWRVRFAMPREYTKDTLPKANNPAIELYETPPKTYVAIQFSWFASPERLAANRELLQQYVAANKLKVIGPEVLAFYDPPWTLPWWRRNEVMFEIKELSAE